MMAVSNAATVQAVAASSAAIPSVVWGLVMGQNDPSSIPLGMMIRGCRKAAGLSHGQVIQRASDAGYYTGLNPSSFSRIENGATAKPDVETLKVIAEGIGVEPSELQRWIQARDAIRDRRSSRDQALDSEGERPPLEQARGLEGEPPPVDKVTGPRDERSPNDRLAGPGGERSPDDQLAASGDERRGPAAPRHGMWSRRTRGSVTLGIGLAILALCGTIYVARVVYASRSVQGTQYLRPFLHWHRCGSVPTHIGSAYFMPARYDSFCNVIEWDFPDASAFTTCTFYGESPALLVGGHRYVGTTDPQYGIFEHRLKVATVPVPHSPTAVWQPLTTINPATIYVQVYDNNYSRTGEIGLGRIKAVCS